MVIWQTVTAGEIYSGTPNATATKGFYSAEFSTTTNRPYVIVNYDSTSGMIEADQNYVPEGQQITLTASGMEGEITWTSSNPARATVSSTGVVTGILAGQVTITASCEGYTDKNCVIWVTVPDGYYYLGSAYSDYILNCGGSLNSSTNTYMDEEEFETADHANEVWKIKYIIGGRYIIRPLSRLASCLTINGSKNAVVVDYHVADSFSAVPLSASWTIGHNSFGYYFYSNNNPALTLRPAQPAVMGSNVVGGSWSSSFISHWELTQASGVFLHEIATRRTTDSNTIKYAELGQSATLSALGLSMLALRHTSGYTWSSSNTQVATVDLGGKITAVGRGETNISVQVSSLGVVYTAVFRVVVQETVYVLNLYDSTFATNPSYIGYIDDAVEFLNTVYFDEFYLHFDSIDPVLYDDPVLLECDNGLTEACTSDNCGMSCINHHKNIMRICNDLYGKWTKNHIVVMWRNTSPTYFCGATSINGVPTHTFIAQDTLAITPYRDLIAEDDFLPVIQVLNIDGHRVNCSAQSFMSLILAHEVAHTIGIHDVYGSDYHDDDLIYDHYAAALDKEYGCLMCSYVEGAAEGFYNSILGFDTAFCAHCKSIITAEMKSDMYQS